MNHREGELSQTDKSREARGVWCGTQAGTKGSHPGHTLLCDLILKFPFA